MLISCRFSDCEIIQLLNAYGVEDFLGGNPGSERAAAAALFGARNSSIRDIYDVAEKVAEISSKVEDLQISVQVLRTEIAEQRTEANQQFRDLRTEANQQFRDLRTEANQQLQDLRNQIADLPKKNDLQDALKIISDMFLRLEGLQVGKMLKPDVDGDRFDLPFPSPESLLTTKKANIFVVNMARHDHCVYYRANQAD